MSTIKRCFIGFFCVLVVLSSFILPASAVDSTYTFNCADPAEANYDGFVVVPIYKSTSNIPAVFIAWNISTLATQDSLLGDSIINSYDSCYVDCAFTDGSINIHFSSMEAANTYYVTWFYMFNGDTTVSYCGSFPVLGDGDSINISISDVASGFSNAYFLKPSYFSGLGAVSDFTTYPSFTYNCLFSGDIEIYKTLINLFNSYINKTDITNDKLSWVNSHLTKIVNHFVSLLSKVDYTNEQLDIIVEKFSELLEVSYSISGTLDDFVYVYFDTFMYYTFPENMSAIISRLDTLIRHLNKKGDSEQTTVDTSNIDNYVDIEQSLVNNEEAESAINDMDISISGKAYSFIWDLVTRIFNSHPEVFGLVIAILTLGFIALLLNR